MVGVYQRHQFETEAAGALNGWAKYLRELLDGGADDSKVTLLLRQA